MRVRTKRAKVVVNIEDATITAEQLTPKEIADIRDKHTSTKGKGLDRVTKPDHFEMGFEMFSRMVKDWSGIVDDDGNALECTPAAKRKVYEFDDSFCTDIMREVGDAISSREETVEKNL